MPIILANFDSNPVGLLLTDIARIGRHSTNDLAFDKDNISTIHAIIRRDGDNFTLEDNGSRSGTILNGQSITSPIRLSHGDNFRIGSILFTYSAATQIPNAIPSAPKPVEMETLGVFRFACSCGRESLIALAAIGRTGKCTRCFREFRIPDPVSPHAIATAATPVQDVQVLTQSSPNEPAIRPRPPAKSAGKPSETTAASAAGEKFCSICQSPILSSNEVKSCPSCRLPFHSDCWHANFGCSAYGCSQVNALKAGPDLKISSTDPTFHRPIPPNLPPEPIPSAASKNLEFIFLGISILAFIGGIFSYGAPNFLALIANILLLVIRGRRANLAVVISAIVLNVLGVVVGFLASVFVLYS